MLTRQAVEVAAPVYPAYRPFAVSVARVLRLSPNFVRLTFTGEDLTFFGTAGLDQRIKVLVPFADGSVCDVGAGDPATILDGSWYARWRSLPPELRNPVRTYTVRAVRPDRRELDVDMVVHTVQPGEKLGPAAAWLSRVRAGDATVVVGPDGRSSDSTSGIDWRPGAARHLLLAGDETAAPAICSIVEQLPAGLEVQAFIEVPSSDDILDLVPRARPLVSWVARDAGCTTAQGALAVAPHGVLLNQVVTQWLMRHTTDYASVVRSRPEELQDVDVDTELLWDAPVDPTSGDFYAWVAGEAATVKTLRRLLVTDVGVARSNVAFMGYWRRGRAEAE